MIGIAATAQRCDQYADASRRLSELLGEWARTDTHPPATAMFAAHCHHLAWHVTLFHERRPVSPVEVPAADWQPIDSALAAAVLADTTSDRVRCYDAVAAQLASAYEHHLAAIDARVDGPTARVLTLALRDLYTDRAEAATLAAALD